MVKKTSRESVKREIKISQSVSLMIKGEHERSDFKMK